jgi:hypothetical protein
VNSGSLPSNIPNPDPSVVANERLEEAKVSLRREMSAKHEEAKKWIENLQELLEEKIDRSEDKTMSLDRVVQTRLAGSETALNAAMAAADKVVSKIETGVGAIMNEMKASFLKQIDSLNEKIDDLKERMSESGGWSKGSGQTITLIVAIISAVAAVISVIVVLMKGGASVPQIQHVMGAWGS